MARIDSLPNFLEDVADAIKEKKGSEADIPAEDFDTEILSIPAQGICQSKTVSITTNNSQTVVEPDPNYDALEDVTINVNVPEKQLQTKNYNFTQNTTTILRPEQGYDGFSSVGLNINVTPMIDSTTATEMDVINPKTFYSNGYKLTGGILPTYGEVVPSLINPPIKFNSTYSLWHISYNKKLVVINNGTSSFILTSILNDEIIYENMVTHDVSEIDMTYDIMDCKFSNSSSDLCVLWVYGRSGERDYSVSRCVINPSTLAIISYCTETYSVGKQYSNNYLCLPRPQSDVETAVITANNTGLIGNIAIQTYRYNESSNTFTTKINNNYVVHGANYFSIPSRFGYWTSDGNYLLAQSNNDPHVFVFRVDSSGNGTLIYNSTVYRKVFNNGYYLQGTTVYDSSGTEVGTSEIDIGSNMNISFLQNLIFIRKNNSTTELYQLTNTFNIVKVTDIITNTQLYVLDTVYAYLYDGGNDEFYGYGTDTEPDIIALTRSNVTFHKLYQADINPSDVLFDKKAYDNSQLIRGTMPNNGTLNYTPSTENQTIPLGYTSGGTIVGDINLVARNIKEGVTIFGVLGTYGGEGGQWVDMDEQFTLVGCNQTSAISDPASVYKNRTTDNVDGSNGWNYRTYLRFDLSEIEAFPENYRITGATLNFYIHSGNDNWQQSTYICTTPSQGYNPDTLCWNNQPLFDAAPISRQFNMIGQSVNTWISLDIIDIVQSWKNGGLDYGLLLKGSEDAYRHNWGLRTMYNDVLYRPYIRLIGKKFISNSDISL